MLNDSSKTDVEKQLSLENFLGEFLKQQVEHDQLFIPKYKGSMQNLNKGSVKEAKSEALKTYSLYINKGDLRKIL